MSSLAGLVHFSGRPVAEPDIEPMLDAMAGRGEDARSIWSAGCAGLGLNLYRTTPESMCEKLPFHDLEAGLVITADARIDNRVELVSELGCILLSQDTVTDSQLILRAYKKWGQDCPRYLSGDFSFAIWDIAKQRLFCAVDPFTVRPFYYYRSEAMFVFSSAISGLLPGKLFPRIVNRVRAAAVIDVSLQEVDWDSTLLEGVLALPAAHLLVASSTSTRVSRYWDPAEVPEICFSSDRAYNDKFAELLERAVSRRLRVTGGSALALSGGIDSTTVAAFASDALQKRPERLTTYSGLGGAGGSDRENACIDLAIEALGCRSVTFTSRALASKKDKLLKFFKESYYPQGSDSAFLFSLYSEISAGGFKVALDGAEADTVLGPNEYYLPYWLRRGKFKQAAREASLVNANAYEGYGSSFSLFSKACFSSVLPSAVHRLRQNYFKSIDSHAWLNPSLASDHHMLNSYRQSRANRGVGLESTPQLQLARALKRPFISHMYNGLDMLSASLSVELRHPYLDRELVEYAVGLPLDQHLRDGWQKSILRRIDVTRVPDRIRWRRGRQHVGWSFLWKSYNLLREEIRYAVHDTAHPVFAIVSPKVVQQVYNGSQSAQGDDIATLLRFFALYMWMG